MDEKPHSKATGFKRPNPSTCECSKPLSDYSRMIAYDQKASLDHARKFSNPFLNCKFEVLNSCVEKKELARSSLNDDDGYESLAKKSFNPKASSPHPGCFTDNPAERPNLPSLFAASASLDKTYALRSEIKAAVNSQLQPERMKCGSSSQQGGDKVIECETTALNLAPVFGLDASGTYSAGGLSKNKGTCRNRGMFQNKKNGRERQMDKRREDPKKKKHLNVKDEEADKGYRSMSYIKEHKAGESPSQSGSFQQPTAVSSLLFGVGEAEWPRVESHPLGSAEAAALSGLDDSLFASDLCPVVSSVPLGSVNSDSENFDGDVEEMWSIGPPMFESSMCHSVTAKSNSSSEQSRRATEELQSFHKCQSTSSEEEDTSDTSYKTTSPLPVQVKSVVIIPNQRTNVRSKLGALFPPEPKAKPARPSPDKRLSQTDKYVGCGRSQRLVLFDRQVWEHRKQSYVHAVTRHMREKPGMAQDVMFELLNLMTHVAEQTPGASHHRQWQHPSDLTRRNYQRRFGNLKPNMSLDEWQAKSCEKHTRFATVPKIFERSPHP